MSDVLARPGRPSSAPPSYATADEARAYVARVLSRPRPASPAPLYLICSPSLRKSPAWPKMLGVVHAKLPGAELLEYRDVFSGAPKTDARIAELARRGVGALVIPQKFRHPATGAPRLLLGYAARAEAEGLVAAGLPVLVLTPDDLVAWPDVRVHAGAPPMPRNASLELDIPEPPAGAVLPTVAASCRALGLSPPEPRPKRAESQRR